MKESEKRYKEVLAMVITNVFNVFEIEEGAFKPQLMTKVAEYNKKHMRGEVDDTEIETMMTILAKISHVMYGADMQVLDFSTIKSIFGDSDNALNTLTTLSKHSSQSTLTNKEVLKLTEAMDSLENVDRLTMGVVRALFIFKIKGNKFNTALIARVLYDQVNIALLNPSSHF